METKVLLRLIRDDIKILESINDSFINQTNLTPEEAEVALARSRALVMEFEMLSKNLAREEEKTPFLNDLKLKSEEKSEKKTRSLRNFLPFVKSDEENIAQKPVNNAEEKKETSSLFDDRKLEIANSFSLQQKTSDTVNSPDDSIPPAPQENGIFISGINSTTINENKIPAEEKLKDVVPEAEPGDEKKIEDVQDEKNLNVNTILKEQDDAKFGVVPLKSIREGIGLNDRFLFIRTLFQNNEQKFEQTISALDAFTNIEEAVKFLKENFKWNKSEAGEKFLFLIKRRFAK